MKKTIAAIFAHPDDEAFGPGGTIAKLAKNNNVYVICTTHGEMGENYRKNDPRPIAEIREDELRCSAKILGVKKVYFLDFKDGTLSNNLYHDLAKKIKAILDRLKPQILITNELRGNSGHIDHITVAMVVSYIFERVPYAKELWRSVTTEEARKLNSGYFIYVPPGYKKSEIDKVVDTSGVWDLKMKAMDCHKSQFRDAKRLKRRLDQLPKEENFQVVKK